MSLSLGLWLADYHRVSTQAIAPCLVVASACELKVRLAQCFRLLLCNVTKNLHPSVKRTHFFSPTDSPNNLDKEEFDIEGAAKLNGIIYWITSHGRNKKGKRKPRRHQFFANEITNSEQLTLKQVGNSYTQLVLRDMFQEERLKKYALDRAEQRVPKDKGGLNIEGLTATPYCFSIFSHARTKNAV